MIKYVLGTVLIALASANVPPSGGSLEDLIHEIFTPPPDLSNKGNVNQPGVIGQPYPIQPVNPINPQQPPIDLNVSAYFRELIHLLKSHQIIAMCRG